MHNAYGFNRPLPILSESVLEKGWVNSVAPVRGEDGCLQREFVSKALPARGKMSGLVDQDPVLG